METGLLQEFELTQGWALMKGSFQGADCTEGRQHRGRPAVGRGAQRKGRTHILWCL